MSILSLFLAVIGMAGGLVVIDQPGPLAQDLPFVVARGDSLSVVADRLDDAGALTPVSVLSGRDALIGTAELLGLSSDIKAGEYLIKRNSSLRSILRTLTTGQSINRSVTIPEGWTVWQAVERLNDTDGLSGQVVTLPPEGTLLPDTYFYTLGENRQAVLDRMMAAHDALFADLWAARAEGLPYTGRQDALILASIIERETGQSAERDMVASVYVNRLRDGWRLQADPTVIYGLTQGQGPLRRGLRRSELQDASNPYNTYQRRGLPPGPIANPGAAALLAALNPASTDYYFFVASCEGGHQFSASLEDHNLAVTEYRACEASLKAPSPPSVRPNAPTYVDVPN